MDYENLSLYNQWIDYQKQCLAKLVNDTMNKNKDEIAFLYFEYYLRALPNFRYEVFNSQELLENPLYVKFKNVIHKIANDAENGISLKPYLSKGIQQITKPDKMLNDWGIVHFHLGDRLNSDGFIGRTSELLFAYKDTKRNQEKLYFLDIYIHGNWSKKRTIEILYNNWKSVIEPYKIKGLVDIKPKLTDEEHLTMRNADINSAIVLEDNTNYIMLGGGMTTAGTNQEATMLKIKYMKYFSDLEVNLLKDYRIKKEQLILKIDKINSYIYLNIPYLNETKKIIPLHNIIILDYI